MKKWEIRHDDWGLFIEYGVTKVQAMNAVIRKYFGTRDLTEDELAAERRKMKKSRRAHV